MADCIPTTMEQGFEQASGTTPDVCPSRVAGRQVDISPSASTGQGDLLGTYRWAVGLLPKARWQRQVEMASGGRAGAGDYPEHREAVNEPNCPGLMPTSATHPRDSQSSTPPSPTPWYVEWTETGRRLASTRGDLLYCSSYVQAETCPSTPSAPSFRGACNGARGRTEPATCCVCTAPIFCAGPC
ncbi:hypothetical protein G7046_g8683 [Stylonectria norvegica]|nr:hypothetical protein G7046_g8683 [Stylonectria norvegica]